MAKNARIEQTEQHENAREGLSGLARWLILVPVLLLLLGLCSHMALDEANAPTADTQSSLQADYQPWPFLVIHPVDPAIVAEILKDQGSEDPAQVVIVTRSIWLINTPTQPRSNPLPTRTPTTFKVFEKTATHPDSATQTPLPTKTGTPTKPPPATSTQIATSTGTPVPSHTVVFVPSSTPRRRRPTHTLTPTPTPIQATISIPTPTTGPLPSDTPSPTVYVSPTLTHTPLPTNTPTPLPFTATPTPTPGNGHRSSIIPVLEGHPVRSQNGTCTATWGYDNPNPFAVDISVHSGNPRNRFSPHPHDRGQPESFQPGRHQNVFTTTWGWWGYGRDLTWNLDGHSATAGWCW